MKRSLLFVNIGLVAIVVIAVFGSLVTDAKDLDMKQMEKLVGGTTCYKYSTQSACTPVDIQCIPDETPGIYRVDYGKPYCATNYYGYTCCWENAYRQYRCKTIYYDLPDCTPRTVYSVRTGNLSGTGSCPW